MIPNFKTYLIESVWGDLRKKSLGQEIREEDSIDGLDRDGFYEYLNGLYISRNPNRNIIQRAIDGWPITMPFVSHNKMYNLDIQYMPNNRDVDYVSVPDACVMWYNGLEDMFDVDGNPDDETKIRLLPKDGKPVTNSFAIVVIDWLLEHSDDQDQNLFDKRTDESVWGDIRKKSLGQEERMEDSFENMNTVGFYEYIKERYNFKLLGFNNLEVNSNDTVISLPIFDYKERSIQHITFYISEKVKKMMVHVSFREQDGALFTKLKYRYKVLGDPRVDPVRYFIKPKDPEKKVTNRFMLEVFDFIVDNISPSNRTLIEKK